MPSSGVNYYSHCCIHERKSRFLKWLSKIFKGRFVRGLINEWHPPFLGGESTASGGPGSSLHNQDDHPGVEREREELDHSIALPLEDQENQNRVRWQPDNTEDLASTHGGLDTSAYPHNPIQHPQFGVRVCAACNHPILYGNYLACMGILFHPECFCCRSCGYPITEREFSLSGKNAYHRSCFKDMTHPKCEVCYQYIPTNGAGLIEYRCHPFWSQRYCPSHEHDHTARCCSCERLESRCVKYVSLGDGRSLCLECMESAIMDTGECQPLYHGIRDFYEGLNMKLDQQIPLLLVERQALNEAIVGEKHGFHHLPETRGLCLSEEQTVTSIHRRQNAGGNRLVGMRKEPNKLVRKCEVTAILVLFGLPRLLTGAILAHELMHGWLRLKGYRDLDPEVEEGICQVLSHLWLESEVIPRASNMASSSRALSSKKGERSEVENKLGEFFLHQIANDVSIAYGEGFRAANSAVNKYGLRRTLDHIRFTGSFPL